MAYTSINKPTDYFNTVLYTGDATSDRTITNTFGTDFLWLKERNGTDWHHLWDKVRGDGKRIHTNNTNAESDLGTYIALVSTGFKVSGGTYNNSGSQYAAWQWKANGSGSSNTDGSITSTVSANTTSGFSIVSYTGTGANATVGHGLGVAPKVVIVKSRSNAESWVYGSDQLTSWSYYLSLNQTIAQDGAYTNIFNGTAPNSTIFNVGTNNATNASSYTYIAYCFAEKKGFSKFGSYTGNGSSDGPFIYTGFKPAWVMIKQTNTTGDWMVLDNKRDSDNGVRHQIYGNTSGAESVEGSDRLDFLSNGIKHRSTGSRANGSGGTYIFMAFAESPFTTSTGIPTTAR
jgi:hypothetical protein